jgi:hypothetical protein
VGRRSGDDQQDRADHRGQDQAHQNQVVTPVTHGRSA